VTVHEHPTAKDVEHALADVDFPISKADLVDHVRANGATEPVERALRAMPPVEYRSTSEVLSSVTLA